MFQLRTLLAKGCAVRFIRQFVEYTLVAAFFMGVPALAALGPRVKFLAHGGRPAHQRAGPTPVRPARLAVRKGIVDSIGVGTAAGPAPVAGYSFGPSSESVAERDQVGRGR